MFSPQSLSDLSLLRETVDFECKLAGGRDGNGAVPEDFWSTYSAFANTQGGVVVLGMREQAGQFSVAGINHVARVRKELFDTLNNRQKVSLNLLTDAHVQELALEGKVVLVIEIPRATRRQRPVYLSPNPLDGHTYIRLNDGDRTVPDEEVKRMLAEQVEDSRDDRIMKGYGIDDLNQETFRAYRQVFANRDSAHPWNALEDDDFLRQIGGWRKDRETGEGGLTMGGLLMFGQMANIQEALPNYMLDYQERPEAKSELRWVDRLTLDGKWSGNLYDFYRKVYLKLTADLKVPFAMEKGERKDETPVHVALREALANALVHADYSDRASVLIVKRPDMFGFRNPGLMRVPPELAIQGGDHDCRNRTLHKMFRFVGVGEQAGSGIPKIYGGWATQHWRTPALYERLEPYNQTLMELRMVDLLPADLVAQLRLVFGKKFDAMKQEERLTLAAAAAERVVTHTRVREMTGLHPVDATRLLQHMVREGFLETHNQGRGMVYCLPGAAIPKPEEVFGMTSKMPAQYAEQGSAYLTDRSAHSETPYAQLISEDNKNKEVRNTDGCLISHLLNAPVVDVLNLVTPQVKKDLEKMAAVPKSQAKAKKEVMRQAILDLCTGRYVTLGVLAELLDRDADALRQQHLKPLVSEGRLELAFPTTPTHAKQAYRSVEAASQ